MDGDRGGTYGSDYYHSRGVADVRGCTFGIVGQYEKLVGRAYGEVDPANSRNAVIADLGLAPTNAAGKVEYSTDIYILRPVVSPRATVGSSSMNNRGNASPCSSTTLQPAE